MQYSDITGVVLAGGQGSRMGGRDKGLLSFRGQPLIEHILADLQTQVGKIIINANRNLEVYRRYGYMVLTDPLTGFQGPLAGMAAALRFTTTPYLLTVPCDAPRFPPVLAERLWKALQDQGAEIAVAHDGTELQPMHALLSRHLVDDLQAFLTSGQRRPRDWYKLHKTVAVDFSDYADLFVNMNTPMEHHRLQNQIPIVGFCAYSGTGKTTLLTQIIPLLKADGLRLAVIKHTHHVLDLDSPGKDSYRLRESGAQQVVLASHKRIISLQDAPHEQEEASLADAIAAIPGQYTDLILVEGFKHEAYPRIELTRASLDKPYMFPHDPNIMAVATDDNHLAVPEGLHKLDINQPQQVVDFIKQQILKR